MTVRRGKFPFLFSVAWCKNVVRPLMLVNSDDDMVCSKENIREDLVKELGGVVLFRSVRL